MRKTKHTRKFAYQVSQNIDFVIEIWEKRLKSSNNIWNGIDGEC